MLIDNNSSLTPVVGPVIKCMGEGSTFGRMANVMTVNIRMIENKDLGYFIGQIANNIKAIGKTVNNMEEE